MSRSKQLGRRKFLKGLAATGATVGVGLPLLRIALNDHGEAMADGTPLPTHFGVWFWGIGIRPARWIPAGVGHGDSWALSSELAPLASVKDRLSVVTNGVIRTDFNPSIDNPHPVGGVGVLTGDAYMPVSPGAVHHTVRQPSVDQLAANHLSANTVRRSLQVGIYPSPTSRFGGTMWDNISHSGPNAPNPAELNLRTFFYRLFPNADQAYLANTRQSVLDVVQAQTQELQKGLGSEDRQRLDQHLEGVRAVERVIHSSSPNIVLPPAPNDVAVIAGNREAVVERNRIISQLVALALSTGVSNVFSVTFSHIGAETTILSNIANATISLHGLTHAPTTNLYDEMYHASVVFVMEQLSAFLQVLQNTPQGASNLLDQSAIMCTSDLSDGHNHTINEFPLLIAGKGGGRLRGNVHHRFGTPTNVSRAVLTALRGAGVSAGSFGVGGAYTDSSIAELEA